MSDQRPPPSEAGRRSIGGWLIGARSVAIWQVIGGACASMAFLASVAGRAAIGWTVLATVLGVVGSCAGLLLLWMWGRRRDGTGARSPVLFASAALLVVLSSGLVGGLVGSGGPRDAVPANGSRSEARPGASGAPQIRREGRFVLYVERGVDLDDDTGSWGTDRSPTHASLDIGLLQAKLAARNGGQLKVVEPPLTYGSCVLDGSWGFSLPHDLVDKSEYTLCVKTTDGRIAALKATVSKDVFTYFAHIEIEATVWDSP